MEHCYIDLPSFNTRQHFVTRHFWDNRSRHVRTTITSELYHLRKTTICPNIQIYGPNRNSRIPSVAIYRDNTLGNTYRNPLTGMCLRAPPVPRTPLFGSQTLQKLTPTFEWTSVLNIRKLVLSLQQTPKGGGARMSRSRPLLFWTDYRWLGLILVQLEPTGILGSRLVFLYVSLTCYSKARNLVKTRTSSRGLATLDRGRDLQ